MHANPSKKKNVFKCRILWCNAHNCTIEIIIEKKNTTLNFRNYTYTSTIQAKKKNIGIFNNNKL